jgi:hypothetical protein
MAVCFYVCLVCGLFLLQPYIANLLCSPVCGCNCVPVNSMYSLACVLLVSCLCLACVLLVPCLCLACALLVSCLCIASV